MSKPTEDSVQTIICALFIALLVILISAALWS